MSDLTLRLNLDAQDVELVLDGKVIDTVGTDVVASWVAALNEKNKPAEPEKPVEEEKPETPEEVVEES